MKYLKSLHLKKVRDEEGVFIVEGKKTAMDVLRSESEILSICATDQFFRDHSLEVGAKNLNPEIISPLELKSISLLQEPDDCFMVVRKKNPQPDFSSLHSSLSVYLDGIRDPGNLGTLLRLCDWFGILNVYCSPDTVDVYNPKVIQSSMGSFLRVTPVYLPFVELSRHITPAVPLEIYGTFMQGENVLGFQNFPIGILVIGNESNGIRSNIHEFITRRISIPTYSVGAESLNAAMACAVILGQFRRLSPA